ncbi:hypothetical protein MMC29_001232 [Sticta canariensis]|nr:hypothetical protein [Sticta canariensis]
MLQPLIALVVAVHVLQASAIYLPPTLADLLREERIASFMAQKPLPTSALLAGAAMTSYPSPLPVGSHPLEAIPKGRVDMLEDEIEDLRSEIEEAKGEIKRLNSQGLETGVMNGERNEKSNDEGHIVMRIKQKAETDRDWTYDEGV